MKAFLFITGACITAQAVEIATWTQDYKYPPEGYMHVSLGDVHTPGKAWEDAGRSGITVVTEGNITSVWIGIAPTPSRFEMVFDHWTGEILSSFSGWSVSGGDPWITDDFYSFHDVHVSDDGTADIYWRASPVAVPDAPSPLLLLGIASFAVSKKFAKNPCNADAGRVFLSPS